MVEMLAVSYSLWTYWSTVAHDRAMRACDAQSQSSKRYASSGWKSPYQSEADAVDHGSIYFNTSAPSRFSSVRLMI